MASSTSQPTEIASADAHAPITILFTDIEGSTRLWERHPDAMRGALARHDEVLRAAIEDAGGTVVKATGDGMMAVFESANDAVRACFDAQRALEAGPWPETGPLRVRMALHAGEVERRGGDYFGPVVNRTARIMAAGHGGQILVSESVHALVVDRLPADAGLADLGAHRLKDLDRPEHLYQLVGPGLRSDFPPLASAGRRTGNLPTQGSIFVGREAELAAVGHRLDEEGARLVTLTGPGGTGKTRLALRAVTDRVDRFEGGAFFVDLTVATDAGSVLALIGRAVGLDETREQPSVEGIARHLQGQQTLLVLDNFEQVTVAAPTVVELLDLSPGVTALVTSREALQVRGERVFAVPPMSLPDPGSGFRSAEELSRFEAIQLFVELARVVRPGFALTDDNASAVAEICLRLDGLPLAIELAAARMNLFSAEALRDRLGSRLKLLRSGGRDAPARQQTLRATIEWSHHLLEPGEQRLFELLSVFGGASFDAVEVVAGRLESLAAADVDVVDGLTSLLHKSLVRDAGAGVGEPRLLMLETIREFATDRLDSQPEFAAAARACHAAFFADLASHTWSEAGARGEADLEALAADLENLRIAWRHFLAVGDLDRLEQLVDALWHLYEVRGWYHASIELMRELLGVLETQPPSPQRWQQEVTLRASLARAILAVRGFTLEVEEAYAQALALFEGQPETPQLYPVLRGLASLHQYRGDFAKGIELGRDILRLAEAQDDPSMRVDGHLVVGSSLLFHGDLQGGLDELDRAIAASGSEGYRARRLRLGTDPRLPALTTSGFALWMLGFPDRALERADRAVALAAGLDHPYSSAYALYHAGFLHIWRREPELARERALGLLGVVDDHDFPIWRALGTCLLGAAESGMGLAAEGLARFRAGLDLYVGLRTPPVFWPLLRYLEARARAEADDAIGGLALIDESLTLAGSDAVLAAEFHVVRGDLLMLLPTPDRDGAATAFRAARDGAARTGARMPALRAAIRLDRLGDGPAAREEARRALATLYGSFTEGFDTADLREARAVLDGAT